MKRLVLACILVLNFTAIASEDETRDDIVIDNGERQVYKMWLPKYLAANQNPTAENPILTNNLNQDQNQTAMKRIEDLSLKIRNKTCNIVDLFFKRRMLDEIGKKQSEEYCQTVDLFKMKKAEKEADISRLQTLISDYIKTNPSEENHLHTLYMLSTWRSFPTQAESNNQ